MRPVQAYIAAMPGWKREIGRYLDALIERSVPDVRKAVRWNTPFYGIEGQGWFLAFHGFTKYVKVTFLNGASLRPVPPVASRQKDVRYFHIHVGRRVRRGPPGELDQAGVGAAGGGGVLVSSGGSPLRVRERDDIATRRCPPFLTRHGGQSSGGGLQIAHRILYCDTW